MTMMESSGLVGVSNPNSYAVLAVIVSLSRANIRQVNKMKTGLP